MGKLADHGWQVFGPDPATAHWAFAAKNAAEAIDMTNKRHGGTWFVGVDALPNAADGSIDGVPLLGPWRAVVDLPAVWHRAQVSVVFAGYPQQDAGESAAAHRFRRDRAAAHMDGLLPEGPERRRHLREPHAFILGIPLNDVDASPLVVWEGSHRVMRRAFQKRYEGLAPESYGDADVTEVYQLARRRVFETCQRTPVLMRPGQAVVLDRHLIHGVAPWTVAAVRGGRQVAYFRPVTSPEAWLAGS